jgi:monovalent cation:H+ antiporter-2, CPA2 family
MNSTLDLSILLIQDFAVLLLAATLAGWLCDKLGISRVVGYLTAGIIIGTPQITWIYVTDADRIQTLSQLGLVFLMFFIGLGFRIRKLRELGLGIIAATACTAMITLTLTRMAGGALGFGSAESLFLAGMLMVSSSAIVGKVLQELGLVHERAGQLAMAVTLLEDLVAIILLAWLGSYAASESGAATSVMDTVATIGSLVAFVVLLVLPGVLFIPKILKNLARKRAHEQETLLVAGLMFAMALLTVRTGFSLALGAFLCGVIVAESPRIRSIESNFSGLRDIFMTVFFTAVGMSIDITTLPDAWGLILLGVGLAFVVRIFASATGLLLAAETESTALKAALSLTPIGEFSFVIASMGIAAGLLEESFQVAAVGISLLTSLLSPMLMKKADTIARVLSPSRLKSIGTALEAYRQLWGAFGRHRKKSIIWRILSPRFWQISRELLLITAFLIFARPVYQLLTNWIEVSYPALLPYLPIYWLLITLLCLPSAVALFRNLNAMSMILGDYFTESHSNDHSLKRGLTRMALS